MVADETADGIFQSISLWRIFIMLDVLLVRIQPTDRDPDGLKHFSDQESLDFKICVLNGDPL